MKFDRKSNISWNILRTFLNQIDFQPKVFRIRFLWLNLLFLVLFLLSIYNGYFSTDFTVKVEKFKIKTLKDVIKSGKNVIFIKGFAFEEAFKYSKSEVHIKIWRKVQENGVYKSVVSYDPEEMLKSFEIFDSKCIITFHSLYERFKNIFCNYYDMRLYHSSEKVFPELYV